MSSHVNQAICIYHCAALAVQALAASAFGIPAEMEGVRFLELAPDLVGGYPQNPGIPHPKAMPINADQSGFSGRQGGPDRAGVEPLLS